MHRQLKNLLLILPTILLAVVFLHSKRFMISDDIAYWETAFLWKKLLQTKPLWEAVWEIYAKPAGRASFHPLLGVPFLWLLGSIKAATIGYGLTVSVLVTTSVYRIFRANRIQETGALAGALVVATHPFLLGQARYFMMEFTFAAASLAALSFFLAERYRWFVAFFVMSLLVRPVEGMALFPAYFLFSAIKENSFRKAFQWRGVRAVVFGFFIATLIFFFRLHGLRLWLLLGTFPASDGQFLGRIRFDSSTLQFVPEKIFLVFGVSGLAILLPVLWRAVTRFRRAENYRAVFLLFLQLVVMLAFNSILDDPGARTAFYRYCLAFFTLLLVACCVFLFHFPKWLRAGLLAWFLAANLIVYLDFFKKMPFYETRMKNPSYKANLVLVTSMDEAERVPVFMAELARILPHGAPARILVSGRDARLFSEIHEMNVRAMDLGRDWSFSPFIRPHVRKYVERHVRNGELSLGDYGFDYVLFSPRPAAIMDSYPFPAFVEILERKKWQTMGLTPVAELMGNVPGFSLISIFRTSSATAELN